MKQTTQKNIQAMALDWQPAHCASHDAPHVKRLIMLRNAVHARVVRGEDDDRDTLRLAWLTDRILEMANDRDAMHRELIRHDGVRTRCLRKR